MSSEIGVDAVISTLSRPKSKTLWARRRRHRRTLGIDKFEIIIDEMRYRLSRRSYNCQKESLNARSERVEILLLTADHEMLK